MPVDGIPKHLVKTLSKAKFEQLADKLIQAVVEPCRRAPKMQEQHTDINEVYLLEVLLVFLLFRKLLRNSSRKNLLKVLILTKLLL